MRIVIVALAACLCLPAGSPAAARGRSSGGRVHVRGLAGHGGHGRAHTRRSRVLGPGHKVYKGSQCTGAVVMGECHGAIIPDGAYHPTCHGQLLNGACTGPEF